jgi:formylglycine-generating enzyme required for sulfatase activity
MSGKGYIVSIGVGRYERGEEGLIDLPFAVRDACLIYDTFCRQFGFEGALLVDRRDVPVAGELAWLRHRSAGPGSADDIRRELTKLQGLVDSDDTVYLFFAGWLGDDGDIKPFGYDRHSSRVTRSELFRELRRLPCERLGLIFSCRFPRVDPHPFSPPGEAFILSNDYDEPLAAGLAADGFHSVFAHGLGAALSALPPGESVALDDLVSQIERAVSGLRRPQVELGVAALRDSRAAGAYEPRLRKPVVVIEPMPPQAGRVGERLRLVPRARGVVARWELAIDTLDSSVEASLAWEQVAGEWQIQPLRAGVYQVIVRGHAHTGEAAERPVHLRIEPAQRALLGFATSRLAVCETGVPYRQAIGISGAAGSVQYEMSGLPSGLSSRLLAESDGSIAIVIEGQVADPPGAGTAASHSGRSIRSDIRIAVTDTNGNTATAVRHLIVVCPRDYVRIPAGEFRIGYHETAERAKALEEMMRGSVGIFMSSHDARSQAEIERRYQRLVQSVTRDARTGKGGIVRLRDFYVRKFPVTSAEWREFVAATGALRPQDWSADDPPFPPHRATLPVTGVTFAALQSYLAWRGTRLPTSWEWERAARGTDGRLFPWGDRFDPAKCNVKESGIDTLTPVDCYQQHTSPDGVCDLVGNAKEWVDRRVFHRGSSFQVFRGGCYVETGINALTFRDSSDAGAAFGLAEEEALSESKPQPWIGFRDVVDLDLDPEAPQTLLDIPEVTIAVTEAGVRRSKTVPPFQMARYAVSNEEYWGFVQDDAHEGTLPAGWMVGKPPPYPPTQRHLPVVGVRLRDAVAFCLWKSRRARAIVRLPTLDQWRAAVDGGAGRRFPWGQTFDPYRCNSLESGWGRRVPVHGLPEGRSAQGVFNLVGNVQEWTTGVSDRDGVLLAGGGWQTDCERLIDSGIGIVVRSNDLGFRYIARHGGG